jgi:RimJ/RimL family protein N-acetyltransferase
LRIVADGCVLRPWSAADVPALVEQCRDPEIVRWLPNIPQPYTDADARSFATAATRALTAWAFETLGATRLALYAEPGNLASQRVAAKCGFVRVPGAVKREADRELWVFELSAP